MLAVMLSCEHKDLYNGLPHVVNARVIFDWKEAPDANPASMSLYLFPVGGGEVVRYDFTDRKGGTFRVSSGAYSVLCLNSDTENIRYLNTRQRETFCVTTREATLTSGYAFMNMMDVKNMHGSGAVESEPIMLPPDMIWSDYIVHVELTQKQLQTITLYPKVSVCRYSIEIRNAENLKYVSGISGVLSSLASGLFAGREETTDERITIPFDGVISDNKTIVTGELLTFGQCHSKPNQALSDGLCRFVRRERVETYLRCNGSSSLGPGSPQRAHPFVRPSRAETHRQWWWVSAKRQRVGNGGGKYRNVRINFIYLI